MQMFPARSACKPSFRVRRFPQVRPRGQSFEAARLHEDWRRGHCASGNRQAARPGPADADGRRASPANETGKADYTLRIAPVTVELAPDHILSTIGYNDTSPGPVLRMREGKTVSVDVINDTDVPELVHWHGMLIPSDVDGVEEEGTPPVPARGRRRYQFTPRPAGSRWYHSHAMAEADLHRGSYTGQFGFVYVDAGNDPGQYDQEIFLSLRDWEPFFTSSMEDDDDDGHGGPQPEKPAVLNTDPNGLEVNSMTYSINDKSLGAGEPIRVKQGQRVLMHLLNASAIENRRIALAGHQFQVIALDGNPVPSPQKVDSILLGAGERVDAIVEMNQPGVWILGATEERIRNTGLGIIVEYENQHRQPQWVAPRTPWDYTIFGKISANSCSTGPNHRHDFRKDSRRFGQVQHLAGKRKAIPARQGVRLKAGNSLPAGISQPHR